MLLIDVHTHLELLGTEAEIAAAIERASAAGVKAVINNSVDHESMRKALELQQRFKIVKAALGLYPTEAAKLSAVEILKEIQFIRSNKGKMVAIGEIGLDYQEAKTGADREKQQELFESQLQLAKEIGKPVIVHSRRAEKEVVETIIRFGCTRVVLHAFHGSMNLVKMAADAGFYITIPTNLARSSHFQAIVRELQLSRLLTETDTPFLAAEKDGSSEPAHIAKTVEMIAKMKKMEGEEVANIIFSNYQRLLL